MLKIGFVTPVRVHHMIIRTRDEKSAPKILKIYKNRLNMNFDDCK